MAVFCLIHPTVQKYDYTGSLKITKIIVIQVLNYVFENNIKKERETKFVQYNSWLCSK